MKKPLIPFSWMPASWGLKGKHFSRAEADYLYDGYELELALIEIDVENKKEKINKIIELDEKYGKIDEYEALTKKLHNNYDGDTLKVELIKLDMEFNKKDQIEGEKEIANILKEPWITIIDQNLDLTDGPNGFYFKFDWNDYWIEMLIKHGYTGINDESIIEQWFNDVCRATLMDDDQQPFGI